MVKAVTVTMTIKTTEVITVTPNETASNLTLDETAFNPNNRPDSFSLHSKFNCTLNTNDKSRRVFKLPDSGSKPGSEEEHSLERRHEQENEPFIVETGLPGRLKKLPSDTTEWVKLSQNKDVFCHPAEPNEDHVSFEDALPPLCFFSNGHKNPKRKCKFQIYCFHYAANSNGCLGSLALNTEPYKESHKRACLDPQPQLQTHPQPEPQPQAEIGAKSESFDSEPELFLEPDFFRREVAMMAMKEAENLRTDQEDEYDMTGKAEDKFFGLW